MFWSLFRQALYLKRTQFATYSLIGLGFLLLYVSVFPAIQEQSKNYDAIFKSLPKALLSAFNITNAEPTLLGYLSSKHFGLVWALMIILLVISYGGFALAKEIENKTMGLLLSMSVSRTKLYIARLAAGIVGLVLFIAVSELSVLPLAQLFGYSIDATQVLLLGLLGLLFGLATLCLAFMFSALFSNAGKVASVLGGVILVMYVLYIVASLTSDVDVLKYFSVFHYFSPGNVILNNAIEWQSIVVFLTISIVSTVAGILFFNKRDIQV